MEAAANVRRGYAHRRRWRRQCWRCRRIRRRLKRAVGRCRMEKR
uniref:Uncharacterized protein n=1 Tax=Cucumis melo TaxID=3656 RepID=A0A9I9CD06_CUCME